MRVWGLLFLAIACEVVGTSSLKATEGFTKLWPSIVVVVGYGAAFYFLSLTLKELPIGVAYAVWSGVGTALVTVVGWLVFKQEVSLATAAGIGLIIAGVVVLNVWGGAHTAEAEEPPPIEHAQP